MYRYQGDLYSRLYDKKNPLTDSMKLLFLFHIASALEKIHQYGLCHFDLKEENIFMLNPYTPVLGDVGMAQKWEGAKKEGVFAGSKIFLG